MTDPSFDTALGALLAGDIDGVTRMLDASPGLVVARRAGAEVPYNGYFCEATLLHQVAGNPLVEPLPASIVDVARLLIERGAEVDACHAGQRGAVEWLLERGVDINVRPHFDHRATPLHWAALGDHAALVTWLLERGADAAEARDETHQGTSAQRALHGQATRAASALGA